MGVSPWYGTPARASGARSSGVEGRMPAMHRNHPKVIQTDIYIHCRNPITTFHNFFLAPFCALINNGGKDCSSPPFVALSIPFGTISLDTYRAMRRTPVAR